MSIGCISIICESYIRWISLVFWVELWSSAVIYTKYLHVLTDSLTRRWLKFSQLCNYLLFIATEKMEHQNVGLKTLTWTTRMMRLTKILQGSNGIHTLRRSIQTNHIRELWTIQRHHRVVAGVSKSHIDLTGVYSNLQSRKIKCGKYNLKVIMCTDLENFCIINFCWAMVTLVLWIYVDPKLYSHLELCCIIILAIFYFWIVMILGFLVSSILDKFHGLST